MSSDDNTLFNLDEFTDWKKEWQDMPEFVQEDLKPFRSVIVHFETKEDLDAFAKCVNQNITHLTKSMWYPEVNLEKLASKKYVDEGIEI